LHDDEDAIRDFLNRDPTIDSEPAGNISIPDIYADSSRPVMRSSSAMHSSSAMSPSSTAMYAEPSGVHEISRYSNTFHIESVKHSSDITPHIIYKEDTSSVTEAAILVTENERRMIKSIANTSQYRGIDRFSFYATIGEINGPNRDDIPTKQLKLVNICIEINDKIIQIGDHMHLSLIINPDKKDCDNIISLMRNHFGVVPETSSEAFQAEYNNVVKEYIKMSKKVFNPKNLPPNEAALNALNRSDERIKIFFTANISRYETDGVQKAKVINLKNIEVLADDAVYWRRGGPSFRETIFTHNTLYRS